MPVYTVKWWPGRCQSHVNRGVRVEGGGSEGGGREGQAEESLPSDQVRLEVETRAVAARPDWEGHFSILSIGHSQVWDIFCQ